MAALLSLGMPRTSELLYGFGMVSMDTGLSLDTGLSVDVRREVDALLDAVDQRPCELPLQELAGLSRRGVQVRLDRDGGAPVVYVAPDRDPAFANLSGREHDVVTLLAGGFSNEQIASTLFVSLATVKGHVHSVFEKTGLTSRTQVVAAWYGGLSR